MFCRVMMFGCGSVVLWLTQGVRSSFLCFSSEPLSFSTPSSRSTVRVLFGRSWWWVIRIGCFGGTVSYVLLFWPVSVVSSLFFVSLLFVCVSLVCLLFFRPAPVFLTPSVAGFVPEVSYGYEPSFLCLLSFVCVVSRLSLLFDLANVSV